MREIWLLAGTDQVVQGVHASEDCKGKCPVHNPSVHVLSNESLGYDFRLKSFYRICSHGQKHQDPDERTFWASKLESAKRGSSLRVAALNKLTGWSCPACDCGCCDLTRIV